jgi:urease beta subunit
MRRRSLGWLGVSVCVAAALAAGPASAGIEVLSQERRVAVDIDVVEDTFSSCIPLITPGCLPDSTTTANHPDSAEAPDTGPFLATANVPGFAATSASQDSEIGAWTIRASGSHAATATFWNTGGFPITFHSEHHHVESRASVEFQLEEAVGYSLDGSVSTGGAIFSASSAWIRLVGPGGVVAEVQVDSDPDCIDPGCFSVGPAPLSASGVLAPGSYTLEAVASGLASGAHSTSGSFGTAVDGAFDVELVLDGPPVPSLRGPALALLALLVWALGGRRLTRPQRGGGAGSSARTASMPSASSARLSGR